MNKKFVEEQKEWDKVTRELEEEKLKLQSYDNSIIPLIEKSKDKITLDYGSGPGVFANVLQKLGSKVHVYDINHELLKQAEEKIGKENVFHKLSDLNEDFYDFIVCNLVVCIVEDKEVEVIARNIYKHLKSNVGFAFIGFCNPLLYQTEESQLDFRYPTGEEYAKNHIYKKKKKEGNYEILEMHRPIEWYDEVFKSVGFEIEEKLFTPKYALKGNKINDFIIYKLRK